MEYKYKSISIQKLPIGNKGVVEPLCNTCVTKDCTNRIENRGVSIIGIVKKMRVLVSGMEYCFVVSCVGYTCEE